MKHAVMQAHAFNCRELDVSSINLADKYEQYNARLFVTLIQSAALRSLPSPFLELFELSTHFDLGPFLFFLFFTVLLLEKFHAQNVQSRQKYAVQLSSALEQDAIEIHQRLGTFGADRHQKGGGNRGRESTSELS